MAGKDTIKTMRYNVQFVDDYAVITVTSIEALDEEDAMIKATNMMSNYYGIDVSGWMIDSVEELA